MDSTGTVYAHALVAMPLFALYFTVAAALLALFLVIYMAMTRHNELELIRAGNTSAGVALGGAVLGFCLPLAKAMAQAHSLPDLVIWGALALLVQLLAYGVANLLVPELSRRIEEGQLAGAVMLAALSVACGLLSAAAMTE